MSSVASRIASVGGLGRLPVGPGTAGSVVGLGLALAGVRTIGPGATLALVAAAVWPCVWCGTQAERDTGQHDPGWIILDEVLGMAVVGAVLPWIADGWAWWAAAFVLFRAFDVIKPPPLRWLARWPGGQGILFDDLGASGYTLAVLWVTRLMTIGW